MREQPSSGGKPRGRRRPRGGSAAGPLLRSKAAQLTDHLRQAVRQGRLAEPVPATRQWSRQLGVSRRTLAAAIGQLEREGWLTVHPRGVRLIPARMAKRARRGDESRVVRLLLFGAYRRHLHNYLETISTLQEQLWQRGCELKWEFCTPSRLRVIARQPAAANELFLLASVPGTYQQWFATDAKAALVLGEVAPGIPLPFINVDQAGAVRHATHRLLRRGLREVILVHLNVESAGIRSAVAAFHAACAGWPRQPVVAKRAALALDQASLTAAVGRLAAGVRERTGFIVVAPIPVGMVVTALWHHGVAVPRQAEIVALFHSPEAVKLYPPPTYYPPPVGRVVRQLTEAAARFFDTGRLPAIGKTIHAEIAAVE